MKKVVAGMAVTLLVASIAIFVSKNNNSLEANTTADLRIDGMHCAACVVTVKKSLQDVPGVKSIRIDPVRSKATVMFNDSSAKVSDLVKAVERSGFNASVLKQVIEAE